MSMARTWIVIFGLIAAACSGGSDADIATTAPEFTTTTTSPPTTVTSSSTTAATTSTTAAPITPTSTTTAAPSAPPEWAAGFDPDGFQQFLLEVAGFLDAAGVVYRLDVDAGVVLPVGEEYSLGLVNLSQQVLQADVQTWPEIVAGHFGAVFETLAANPGVPPTWEDAEPVLRIRIYDTLFFEGAPEPAGGYLREEIVRGVFATVVLDLPTAVRPIGADEAAPWGVAQDEVSAAALENTLVDPDLVAEPFQLETGIELVSLYGSFFTSTHVLDLPAVVDGLGAPGALVIMPVRDSVVVHVVKDQTARSAFEELAVIVDGWYADGPGSLSPFVYWWRDGQLVELGFLVPGVGPGFAADIGPEFLALLETLPEG